MAFSNSKFTLLAALVSAAALISSVGCSDDTDGTGGAGPGSGGNGVGGGNGGSGNTGNEGGSGAQGGSGGGGTTDCEAYCAANLANCTAGNVQYATDTPTDECEAMCSLWDQGTPGAMAGDTTECRVYHTGAAASDAATHCPHGGPFGGGVCGADQCEVFCAAVVLLCTGDDEIYSSEADCLTDCDAFAGKDTPFVGNPADATDSFACRAYHLTAASTNPAVHCQHAGGPNSEQGDSDVCNN